jgi:hypothetical protein
MPAWAAAVDVPHDITVLWRSGRSEIMRQILASPQVEALVGTETIQQLYEDPYAMYTCRQCGRPGTTSEATTVTVEKYRRACVVSVAHARCADSQVIEIDADLPSADTFGDMNAKLAVLSYPTAPRFRPLLVLEPRVEASIPAKDSGQQSLWVSMLVESGLTLMRTGDQMPSHAEGWRLQLLDPGHAQLLDPNGQTIYIGDCSPTSDWLDLASEINGCVVLIGSIGLYAVSDDDMTPDRFTRMLDKAARRSVLAGGLVVVEH